MLHLTETQGEAVAWDDKYWVDLSASEVESTHSNSDDQVPLVKLLTKPKEVVTKQKDVVAKGTKWPVESQKGKAKKKPQVIIC